MAGGSLKAEQAASWLCRDVKKRRINFWNSNCSNIIGVTKQGVFTGIYKLYICWCENLCAYARARVVIVVDYTDNGVRQLNFTDKFIRMFSLYLYTCVQMKNRIIFFVKMKISNCVYICCVVYYALLIIYCVSVLCVCDVHSHQTGKFKCPRAVSYTHLDVYKRQRINFFYNNV